MTSCAELMQMILPAAQDTSGRTPGRLNALTASHAHRNWPVRLTPSTVFHCCSVIVLEARVLLQAGVVDQTSIVPKSAIIVANIACT